jgi:hypothetical protein
MKPGWAYRIGLPVDLAEQPPGEAAELAQAVTLVEAGAQEPGDGEHVLAVRDRGQDLFFDPLAVDQVLS